MKACHPFDCRLCRCARAIRTLADWSDLVGPAIDSVRVSDNPPMRLLLAVYKHYADAIADWGAIQTL
jgi:hypothetical protein